MSIFLFWTKKALTSAIYPVPMIVLLVGVALILLLRMRGLGFAKLLIALACLLLIVFSNNELPDFLVNRLEGEYKRLGSKEEILAAYPDAESTIQYIVVLGGGAYDINDPTVPDLARLPNSALMRVVESVRLHSYFPQAKLVMSGGPPLGIEEAEVMRHVAISLGVPPEEILKENQSLDTAREALFVKPIVGSDRFFLVTSAWHMPRAAGLFHKQGLNFIPAPTDFWTLQKEEKPKSILPPLPNAFYLMESELVIKEYVGILVGKLNGKI